MSDQKPSYLSTQAAHLSWRRWEMGAFDRPRDEDVIEQDQGPTQEDILRLEALATRVRQEAQKKGHAEGYAQGHEEGAKAGQADGYAAGHAKGYEEGYRAGIEAGRAQSQAEAARLAALAGQLSQSLTDLEKEVGQSLISLALDVARQVVRSTLDAAPDKILDIVRDVIHLDAGRDAMVRLRVHPDDASLIQEHLDSDPSLAHWRLIEDPAIEAGGCIAETGMGNIDATLRTRWERVAASLGDARGWSR